MDVANTQHNWPVTVRALAIGSLVASAIPLITIIAAFWTAFGLSVLWRENMVLLISTTLIAVICVALTALTLWLPLLRILESKRSGLVMILLVSVAAGLPAAVLWLLVHGLLQDTVSKVVVAFWPVALVLPGFLGGWAYWWRTSLR